MFSGEGTRENCLIVTHFFQELKTTLTTSLLKTAYNCCVKGGDGLKGEGGWRGAGGSSGEGQRTACFSYVDLD